MARTAAVTGAVTLLYMLAPTWLVQFMGPPETTAVFFSYHSWVSGMMSNALFLPSLSASLTLAGTIAATIRWTDRGSSLAATVLFAVAAMTVLIACIGFHQVTAVPLLLALAALLASPWAALGKAPHGAG